MYEDITIRQFIDASFKGDRSIMNEDQFKLCTTEYIDTAGLFESEIFTKECYIQYLTNRINRVAISIETQRKFLKQFGIPYHPNFEIFSKLGYNILWKNKTDFLKKLKQIESMETPYISQLELKVEELEKYKKSKGTETKSEKLSRGSFIQTLNSLGKIGWKIDKDKDSVEDLAYMIKQQLEDNKRK